MAKRTIEKKSKNNLTKDGKPKTFIIDKYLAEQVNWSRFTYKEIIVIANLIADINPNDNEIKSIIMTAKEFNEKCCFKSNIGTKNMIELLASIKSKVFSICVAQDYNPDKNKLEENNIEEALAIESDFEVSSTKKVFPMDVKNISLIGASRVLTNQDKDLTIRAKQVEIFFDIPLWNHLLVARNAYKDDKGKLRGVEQYYSTKLYIINSFRTEYALRLYMSLLRYNNISKKFSWKELKSLIGKKTQKANFEIEQKSRNSENPRKISKERKEFENFQLKTLPNIFKEIRECTGLDYSYELRVADEIAILIHIPNRTDKLSLLDELGFNIDESNNKSLDEKTNEDNDLDNNFTENLNEDNVNEINTFCDDDTEIDWNSIFNQMNYEEESNCLDDNDLQHIDNLYKIYSIKMNISKKEIEEIFINNNKDPKLTNKVLSNIIK